MELNSELERLQKYAVIDSELIRARKLHPNYPSGIFEKLAIMQEEAGEVAKAVLDLKAGGTIEDVKTELIQTAAMCMRMLESLEDNDKEHLCRDDFESAVEPAIRYLLNNHHPHAKIVIDYERAELLHGQIGHVLKNEIPD